MAFNLRNILASEARIAPPLTWVRPSDWPVVTDNDNMIQLVLNDTNRATYWFDFTYAGLGVINWGDGNTETLPNGGSGITVRVEHTYTPGTGATCSLGYTTFVAQFQAPTLVGKVIPVTGLTASDGTFLNSQYSYGILEIYIGDNSYDFDYTNAFGFASTIGRFSQLQYVKFQRNIPGSLNLTTTFEGCTNLMKVDLPETVTGSLNITQTFKNCFNLRSVTLPETPNVGITTLFESFNFCRSLTEVIFPSHLNNLTTISSAFNGCFSLIYIDIPPMPNCLDYTSAFQVCYNLQSFRFKTLPNRVVGYNLTFDSMFFQCYSLESVEFPNEFLNGEFAGGSGNNFITSQMFNGCVSLRAITYPRNWNPILAQNTHLGCTNLQYVNYQTPIIRSGAVGFNASSHFSTCRSLKTVYFGGEKNEVIISLGGGLININGFFDFCQSLADVKFTISNTAGLTSMQLIFNGCNSLVRADFRNITTGTPGAGVSGISTLNNTFSGCSALKEPIFPTNLQSLTDFTSCFLSCVSLEEFVVPNTLNVTTYTSMFQQCSSLRKVTFGTTGAAALSSIGSLFNNCVSLREVDLSNLISASGKAAAIGSLISVFNNCNSLERINMGSFQFSTLTTITGFLTNCSSLETITNDDKIGNTSTSAGTYLVWGTAAITAPQLQSFVISSRISILTLNGASATQRYNLQSLRLLNHSAGQFTGSTTPILIQWCNMQYAALITLFNDLAAKPNVTGRTINITGNPGVASLTAGDRNIITSKGWTIVS